MSKSNVAETNRATHGKFIQIIYKIKQNYFSLNYFYHCCPGKKHQGYISVSISMPLWRFRVMGLTLKPVRAGQGIGRGGAQRNPCKWTSPSSINPVRGDRLCINTLLPPRWGLDVCTQQLQGFHSASPRYTPA